MNRSVEEIIAEVIDVDRSQVTDDATRETLPSWDSLSHLQIIAEIESEFGIKIPFEDVSKIHTVADFSRYIRK